MMTKFILPAFILLMSAESFSASRIKCPEVSDVVPAGATLESYQTFFTENNIVPKTELSLHYVEQFKNEFEKFPMSLRQELILAGNKIHIMEGTGVTVDPTWIASDAETFDGRPWSEVPGGGGSTARGYKKTPTRIVINHIYDHHGSAALFLHEHGHSLDSIRKHQGISRSRVWTDVMATQEGSVKFLNDICGSYCTNNVDEGFAELLANYYACEESRSQMERDVPRIAEFFKRFNSTKDLDKIWADPSTVTKVEAAPESRAQQVRRRVKDIFGKLIPNDDE